MNKVSENLSKENKDLAVLRNLMFVRVALSIFLTVAMGFSISYKLIRMPELYKSAVQSYDSGDFTTAGIIFASLGKYKDSEEYYQSSKRELDYEVAQKHMADGEYSLAMNEFYDLGDFKDSKEVYSQCVLSLAEQLNN